jgi:hypothetical protein
MHLQKLMKQLILLTILIGSQSRAAFNWTIHTVNVEAEDEGTRSFLDRIYSEAKEMVIREELNVYQSRMSKYFYSPITNLERIKLDSLGSDLAGTWSLTLLINRSVDTLIVLALDPDVEPNAELWKYLYGHSYFVEPHRAEPLYQIPLSRWSPRLNAMDKGQLDGIIQSSLYSLAPMSHGLNGSKYHAFEWTWEEDRHWLLLEPDVVGSLVLKCLNDLYFMARPVITRSPGGRSSLTQKELSESMIRYERVTINGKPDSVHYQKRTEALELTLDLEQVKPDTSWSRMDPYRAYRIQNSYIGIRYHGDDRSEVWMGAVSFSQCYGSSLIEGWLKAVFANEIIKRLQRDP